MKTRKLLVNAGFISGGVLYLVLGIAGLLIHLWTIIISLAEKGIIAALISLVLPVVAEIYWVFASCKMTGTWFNTYTIAIISYVVLWLVAIGLIAFCGVQSEKLEQQEYKGL